MDDFETNDEDDKSNLSNIMERREALKLIRSHRCTTRNHIEQMRALIDDWNLRLNAADCKKNRVLSEYQDMLRSQKYVEHRLELNSRCNVTNDCFYIWFKGIYGTINGLRLGFVAHPNTTKSSSIDNEKSSHGYLRSTSSSETKETNTTIDRHAVRLLPNHPSKLTWLEVNTALGLVAHLLYILQKKCDSTIYFASYEIMPMGCYSKIGEKQPDQKPSIWYNLYYNDEHSLSFLFSQRKLFNKALNGLGVCLADAIACATNKDRTLVIPYPISVSSHGVVTIDTLSLSLGNNGDEWTRAMKYFLTDLKWLVVYATKQADR